MGRLTNLPNRLGSNSPRLRPAPKRVERFYSSRAWRSLVAQIKKRRGAHCEVCGSKERIIADHIRERKDGGADLDPTNIQLLCHPCHQRKTARAREARQRGEHLAKGKAKRGDR